MCNLYSITKGQAAIRELARAMRDQTGNLPPIPGVFPDYSAPIVRTASDGVRELAMARWGMPSPAFAPKDKKTDPGVTNVRNTKSPHWRRWLGPESRCLVPFTSFSEPDPQPDGKRPPAWFALSEDRPLAFFAGIWVGGWKSVRKVKEGEIEADLFAFLTTEPNAEVGALHPKAMPVILTEPEEIETWMTAPATDALALQRPLPDGALRIVARGRGRTETLNALRTATEQSHARREMLVRRGAISHQRRTRYQRDLPLPDLPEGVVGTDAPVRGLPRRPIRGHAGQSY